MTDLPDLHKKSFKIDKAFVFIGILLLSIAFLDSAELQPIIAFSLGAIMDTASFIGFAVLAVAYLKASGAEHLLARAFEGSEGKMIIFAAILGGIAPFCSCEVIPFIAALLAVGAPLGAVMAFWLASPLMDPAMFIITSGTLGWDFAIAKALTAIGVGVMGGVLTMTFAKSRVFANPLRHHPQIGGCCGSKAPFQGQPVWAFWQESERRKVFQSTGLENAVFLFKWLTLAYIIEAVMLRYIPAELVAGVLGGSGIGPIIMGAVVGTPAYLNGYAAVPLVEALLSQGMSNGAAMSFVIAGGVSCIPAAIAVWALVKPRIFFAYLSYGITGAVIAGVVWQAVA